MEQLYSFKKLSDREYFVYDLFDGVYVGALKFSKIGNKFLFLPSNNQVLTSESLIEIASKLQELND